MSAATAFLDLVVEAHGQRVSADLIVIRRGQAELAREFGYSRGTVAKWLRQLRPSVRVLARGEIVVEMALDCAPNARQMRAFSGGAQRARNGSEGRAKGAQKARNGAHPGSSHADISAGQRQPFTKSPECAPLSDGAHSDKLASSSLSREVKKLASLSSDSPKCAPPPVESGPPRLSDDSAIDVALADLVAYAERCSPPPPMALNAEGRRLLGQYPPAGLAHAAAEVMAQLKAGKVRRPLGLLVTKARAQDHAFFTPASTPTPARQALLEDSAAVPAEAIGDPLVGLAAARSSLFARSAVAS